jgi:hypothetical protein
MSIAAQVAFVSRQLDCFGMRGGERIILHIAMDHSGKHGECRLKTLSADVENG